MQLDPYLGLANERIGLLHFAVSAPFIWEVIAIRSGKPVTSYTIGAALFFGLALNCMVAWLLGFEKMEDVSILDFNQLIIPGTVFAILAFILVDICPPKKYDFGLVKMRQRSVAKRAKAMALAMTATIGGFLFGCFMISSSASGHPPCETSTCGGSTLLAGFGRFIFGPLLEYSLMDIFITVLFILGWSFLTQSWIRTQNTKM